jgi:hypothetical protein
MIEDENQKMLLDHETFSMNKEEKIAVNSSHHWQYEQTIV